MSDLSPEQVETLAEVLRKAGVMTPHTVPQSVPELTGDHHTADLVSLLSEELDLGGDATSLATTVTLWLAEVLPERDAGARQLHDTGSA